MREGDRERESVYTDEQHGARARKEESSGRGVEGRKGGSGGVKGSRRLSGVWMDGLEMDGGMVG